MQTEHTIEFLASLADYVGQPITIEELKAEQVREQTERYVK